MRWALAGYGDLAERRLVDALRCEGRELVSVWGRRPERAAAFAARHGIARAATRVAELFHNVDAVYVATPVSTHVELAIEALSAGCHVLVEKPLSPALAASTPLVAMAESSRRTVAVAYYRRLDAALARVRQRVGHGDSPVRRVQMTFSDPFDPEPGHPKAWRLDPRQAGAGCLADAGSHRLDLLAWTFGAPEAVRARCFDRSPQGAERRVELEFSWPTGLSASCRFAWREAPVDRLVLETESQTLELAPLDSGTLRTYENGRCELESWPRAANPHRVLVDDFERAVRTGGDPACSLRDARIVDRMIEAALRSDQNAGAREPVTDSAG